MKKLKNTLLTLGLAASTSLFLAGCAEGDQAGHDHEHDENGEHVSAEAAGHDADGEDHGAEHEGHDSDAEGHHAEGEDNDATQAVAGKLAETAGAMAVIEKPNEEQLKGTKEYTLKTCIVSGEELGSMGEPLVFLVGDQQVKLCCDHCVPDLKKDTAKLMAKLSE